MSTKSNPGPFDCLAKLGPDEPYFLFRGKDPLGEFMVAIWTALRAGDLEAALRKTKEAYEVFRASGRTLLPYTAPKSIEAQQCAKAMRVWQENLKMDAIKKRLEPTP